MRFYRTMALRLRQYLLSLQGTPVDNNDEDEEVDDSELSVSDAGGSKYVFLTCAVLCKPHSSGLSTLRLRLFGSNTNEHI